MMWNKSHNSTKHTPSYNDSNLI